MLQQTLAIIRNTFFESIRQPIMLVILVIATLLIIISNPLSGYTMSNDQKMLIDVGLATVFICGAVLAAFVATSVLGREIENRTALTVISKPVSRPVFVIGKYLGVAGALLVATAYMSFVFLLVEQHKVLQTVRDPVHVPVVVFGLGAAVVGLGVGIWCNYFYSKVFSSTVICVTTPLAGLAYLFSLMFRHDFSLQPMSVTFKPQLWLGLAGLLIAILVLTAIAIAASTRLGQVLTLCVTVGVFMAGMLSDWMIGRPIDHLKQDWLQRVREKSDAEIRESLSENDLNSVRNWVRDLYEQHALARFDTWHCTFVQSLRLPDRRFELEKLGKADRQTTIDAWEGQDRDSAAEALSRDLISIRARADALHWPLAKADLIHEFEWPLKVERTNGECETIPDKREVAYPPLVWSSASRKEQAYYLGLITLRAVIPNFQVLWLSDAITQEHEIPPGYLARTMLYGLLYIFAAISLAMILFQRREVG